MRELFDSISIDTIDEFIRSKQEEHLHLEFKTLNSNDLSNRTDRKNFAKALSGFANSDGGLIIWGVEANDKNEDGIDCASSKDEIESISKLISKLNEYTGQATSPTVDGVLHKEIIDKDDIGVAVTFVPASDLGPHMAKLGEDRYYKRSGDSFYKMEHFDIADMFGRRPKPELRLLAKPCEVRKPDSYNSELLILISIENIGRGTAKAPYLSIEPMSSLKLYRYGIDGNRNHGLPRIHRHKREKKEFHFGGRPNIVIHPGNILDVLKLSTSAPREFFDINKLYFKYQLGAEDYPLTQKRYEISESEIHKVWAEYVEK